jgi:hypothetical protein
MTNGINALLGASHSELDHRSGLGGIKFVLVALVGLEDAQLHWEEASAGRLDKWKIPILKSNIVFSFKIVVNRDFRFGIGTRITVLEEMIFGVYSSL